MRYLRMLGEDVVGWPLALLASLGIAVGLREQPARTAWLLSFGVPFFLFVAGTFPASRYLVPLVPFAALFAGSAFEFLARRRQLLAVGLFVAACILPLRSAVQADLFIRRMDTRTEAKHFIEAEIPAGATILTQPYSVPLEPTAACLREAVSRSGRDMPTKTALEAARDPYPTPAYRLLYIGRGLDADKIYVPQDELAGTDPLAALRREHVAFVVLKRYNDGDPAALPFLNALARQGRRLAVFSPYRDGGATGADRPAPFLHNTDARIDPALERPGPVMEIWQIDGPRS